MANKRQTSTAIGQIPIRYKAIAGVRPKIKLDPPVGESSVMKSWAIYKSKYIAETMIGIHIFLGLFSISFSNPRKIARPITIKYGYKTALHDPVTIPMSITNTSPNSAYMILSMRDILIFLLLKTGLLKF